MEEKTLKMLDSILNEIPYTKDFPMDKYEYNCRPGSMPAPELLVSLVNQVNPTLIIEIGSCLGFYAITMGNALKEKKTDFRIICVDTWLQGDTFEYVKNGTPSPPWNENERKYVVNGYPTTYYQFIYNVIHNNLQNNIIPLPRTSRSAAFILKDSLKSLNIEADIIYVDGSHEDIDAYYDCKDYWPLVKTGGILFGDDWTWAGVESAVRTFAEENKLQIQLHQNGVHWFIKKI